MGFIKARGEKSGFWNCCSQNFFPAIDNWGGSVEVSKVFWHWFYLKTPWSKVGFCNVVRKGDFADE